MSDFGVGLQVFGDRGDLSEQRRWRYFELFQKVLLILGQFRPLKNTSVFPKEFPKVDSVSVEMEAAALLSLGKVLNKPVVCLAHVTNTMATREEDFEKGGDAGLSDSLSVCSAALEAAMKYGELTGQEQKAIR